METLDSSLFVTHPLASETSTALSDSDGGSVRYRDFRFKTAPKREIELSSASRVELLTNELTSCKVQLRIYEQFLRDHVSKQQPIPGPVAKGDHAEVQSLVDSLYHALEESQDNWKSASQRVAVYHQKIAALEQECAELRTQVEAHSHKATDAALSEEIVKEVQDTLGVRRLEVLVALRSRLSVSRADTTSSTLAENGDASFQLNELAQLQQQHRELLEQREADRIRMEKLEKDNERTQWLEKREAYLQKQLEDQETLHQKRMEVHKEEVTPDSEQLRELEQVTARLQSTQAEFEKFKSRSEETIRTLTAQLSNSKQDLVEARRPDNDVLERALEKQRVLTSEKIKLSYQVDGLLKEKAQLQGIIDQLREAPSMESLSLSPQPKEFKRLRQDVAFFKEMLELLETVAEDEDLGQAQKHIVELGDMCKQQQGLDTAWKYHRNILGFFTSAVKVIVQDHVQLFLKHSEAEKRAFDLELRQVDLETENRHLKEQTHDHFQARIEALSAKWKYEREARVFESKQAKKRLLELERELELRR